MLTQRVYKDLREKGIVQVVICGISTTGVVLSTLQGALDVGLHTVVVSDACMDPDPSLHEAMLRWASPLFFFYSA